VREESDDNFAFGDHIIASLRGLWIARSYLIDNCNRVPPSRAISKFSLCLIANRITSGTISDDIVNRTLNSLQSNWHWAQNRKIDTLAFRYIFSLALLQLCKPTVRYIINIIRHVYVAARQISVRVSFYRDSYSNWIHIRIRIMYYGELAEN